MRLQAIPGGELMTAAGKSFEVRIADLVRLLGSESEGEVLSAHGALKRLLASRERQLHRSRERDRETSDRRARGGPNAAPLRRRLPEGASRTRRASRPRSKPSTACVRTDLTDWEAIALYCQREKARLKDDRHHQFVDDMASRMTWSREPTEKQAKYLLGAVSPARREGQNDRRG